MKRKLAQRAISVASTPHRQAQLRHLPRVKFVQWAVRALGGKWQTGWERARGYQGQIIPWSSARNAPMADGCWYPIQVKQKDKTGRPDIDAFEAVMMREERTHGFFVSFDFTEDAYEEIGRFFKRTGRTIKALTVKDILDEAKLGMKLA